MILTIAMAHPRTEVREKAVAMLLNATAAGARVYDARIDPIKDLPAIDVFTWTEDSDAQATSPPTLKRELELDVVLYVAHTEAVSAVKAADNLALQVEAIFDADPFLQGKAEDCVLKSTVVGVRPSDGAGSPLVGEATMTYGVTYRTNPIGPQDLDDLTTVVSTTEIEGGVDDTPPAIDQFTVET